MDYYKVFQVLLLCLSWYPSGSQILHYKEWRETVKSLEAIAPHTDLSDIIDLIPGIDCSVRPDWPGPFFNFEFTCDILPPSDAIPTSVHRLRPADIKVIAAFGDSLTAANGAKACFLPELAYEYRGRSFSHGGDISFEKNPTLANILRKFNPDLKGYGIGTGRWDSSNSSMNVGVPGSVAFETVEQARNLVEKMKLDPTIDYDNDWKIVTIFIGGNDICDWCNNNTFYHPDEYVHYVKQALTILHDEMPRAFVNVISPLQVDAVRELRGTICDTFHYIFCPCVINVDEKHLKKAQQTTKAYQKQLTELINSGHFDDKEDFTVVLQPFFENTVIPLAEDGTPDASFFAPDCFHFSSKGHAAAGQELWNNMFEPVGNKRTQWIIDGPLTCPTKESPYLYTNKNSGNYASSTPQVPEVIPTGSAPKQIFFLTKTIFCTILSVTLATILY